MKKILSFIYFILCSQIKGDKIKTLVISNFGFSEWISATETMDEIIRTEHLLGKKNEDIYQIIDHIKV